MLKNGTQDIDRTTPHVNIFKLVTDKFISSEDISRRYVLRIGHVLLNTCGITSIYGPKV